MDPKYFLGNYKKRIQVKNGGGWGNMNTKKDNGGKGKQPTLA